MGITDDAFKATDSAHPEALSAVAFGSKGADCNGHHEKAISKEEIRP